MAKSRRRNEVRVIGVVRRKRSALLMSTALQATVALVLATPAGAQPAPNAQPRGGVVVAGSAAISQTTNNTAINQSTQRAAVNWNSFNVGSQQSVTFNQPNASAVTLNRVTGPDPSQIAGRIDANGQVILTNQSGVTFYKGAQVNTNGLMVSAIGASDQSVKNFMASPTGTLALDQPGNPNAKVDNRGNITVSQAGLAALMAPRVANSGTITAQLGHVVLAGAKTATLDLYGDGLLSLDVTNQVTQAPVDKQGNTVTALVTNTGTVIADGGTIQLTARAADGIVQTLVQAGGKIRAATMGDQTGTVALNGVGGSIVVEGQLSAPGYAPGTTGGNIEVATTGNVVVASTAKISASGKAGGGTVAIGTNLARARGGPSVMPTVVAANTVVQAGAKISANATSNGNGGRITVLSGQSTTMAGTINAKGGTFGGNGGFVEVSGNTGFSLTGMIDVSAPMGATGMILLDPLDLDIVAAGANDGDVGATGVDVASPDQATSITVSGSALTALSGNLQIEASRNLTVDTPLTFANQTIGTTVQLLAGNNLTVNQAVNTAGGALDLAAAVHTDGVTIFTNFNPAGVLTINAPVGNSSTGEIQLTGGTGGVALAGNVQSAAGAFIEITSTGGITQTAGSIVSSPLVLFAAGPVSLPGANTVTLLAAQLNGAGSSLTFNNTAAALAVDTVGGVSGITTNAGDVSLSTTTSGGITLNQSIAAAGNTVTINSAGTLSQVASSVITANALASTGVAGNVSLFGTLNAISNLNAFTATAGNVAINDSVPLTIAGNVSATSGNVYLQDSAAGGITFGAFSVSSVAGGTVGLQTNALANLGVTGATGAVNTGATGTFELAPNTANPETLGAPTGLSLTNLTGITAGMLRIGAVTQPGTVTPTISATAIAVTGAFDLGGANLDLQTTGAITQTAALTTVGTLTGTAASANLNQANAISNVGSFSATAGDFLLTDGGLATTLTVSGPLTGTNITLSGAPSLSITGSISSISGAVNLTATGLISESGAGAVGTTGLLTTSSGTGTTLNGANTVGSFNATNTTSGNIALTNTAATLTVTGISQTGGGSVTLNDTGALSLTGALGAGAGNVNLTASTLIGESGAGAISTTGLLTTSSGTGTTLNGANTVGSFNATNTTSGNIALIDTAATLTITGISQSGGGNVTVNDTGSLSIAGAFGAASGPVNLTASTLISESGAGAIGTTGLLTTSSVGGTTLNGANTVGSFNATNTTSGNVALTNTAATLTVTGISQTGGGTVTTNDTGALSLTGALTTDGGNVNLTATTLIGESGAGAIGTTGLLTTSSGTGTTLNGANTVDNFNATNTTSGNIVLTNTAATLTVTGVSQSGGGNVTVDDTGALSLTGALGAASGPVHLTASTLLSEGGAGAISTTGLLTTSSAGGTTLNGANTVGSFNATNTTSGNVALINTAATLTITGVSQSGGGNVTVNDTGALSITGAFGAASGPVNLTATTLIGESGAGAIGTTGLLTTSSATGTTLNGANTVDNFNATNTTSGNVALTNTAATLTITGVSQSGGGNVTVDDTGALSLTGALGAVSGNVSLTASGLLSESGAGAVSTTGLLTTSSAGGTTLNGGNTVGSFNATNTTAGDIALTNTAATLTITGISQSGGGNVTINDTGALSITGAFGAASGPVNLTASTLISESGAGEISTTGLLTTSSATGTTLNGANTVGSFNATNTTSGNVSLTNTAATLTVKGVNQSGGGNVTIDNTGSLSTTGAISAGAGAVTLSAFGVAPLVTVGNTINGNALTVTVVGGGQIALSANVTTSGGGQSYSGGPISLTIPVTLTDTGGGSISLLDQTTGGTNSLTLSTTGQETLSGVTTSIGLTLGTPSLLTLNAGTYTIATGTYTFPAVPTAFNGLGGTLTFGQATTFNGPITLSSSSTVDSSAANGALGFVSTIDAATASTQSLTITSGTGLITLGGPIGGTQNLLNFSATGGAIAIGGNITADATSGILTLDSTGATTLTLPFNLSGSIVNLFSGAGAITQSGGIITATTLTGKAVTGATLGDGNAITTLGSFNVSSGTLTLSDIAPPGPPSGTLTVSGPVTASSIAISGAPTIAVGGSVGATSTVSLTSGAGGIALGTGAIVTGATIDLNGAAGGIAITNNAILGAIGDIVDLTTTGGGVTESGTSSLIAATLQSSGGIVGSVSLPLGSNNIFNLGSIAVTGGGSFALNDTGHSGALNVVGPVTANIGAGTVSITGMPTLVVGGSIGAATTIALTSGTIDFGSGALVTAPTIDLSAGVGGIGLTGNASVGQALALIDMTSTGTVTEAATSVLTAGTLQSTLGVSAGVSLLGTSNAIAGLGNFAVTGGANAFALDDSVALAVAGTVSAPGQVYLQTTNAAGITINAGGKVGAGTLASFQADAFVNNGTVTGATFEWAPATTGATQTLPSLLGIGPTNVRLGAVTPPPGTGSPTTTAGSIVVSGSFGTLATLLELDSLGGISETGTGTLVAASLIGTAGSTVALTNVNTIAALGSFPVTGGGSFTLTDNGEAANLSVTGPVTATSVTLSDTGTVTVTGSLTASAGVGAVKLTSGGGGILLNAGALLTGGTVDLNATGGGVTETSGVIAATTLLSSGGITGNVTLGSLNNVATLAGFAVASGDFLLSDGASATGLTVAGPLTANTGTGVHNITLDDELAQLVVTGSIGASGTVLLDGSTPSVGVALNGGAIVTGATIDINGGGVGIAMNGNASVGTIGAIVDLTTTGGGVTEATTGVITAGALQSTGGIVGTVNLLGTGNAIADINTIGVTGGSFSLVDTGNLGVAGKLSATGVTINDSGALNIGGTVTAAAVSLTAASMTIPGTVGGTTVALFSTGGAIGETGVVNAVTLTGTAATSASLTGTAFSNSIGTVNGFTAASGFTLDDGIGLSMLGLISGGPNVTVLNNGALAIGGAVTAAAVSLTAGSITIPGTVGGTTVGLFGTVGAITEIGVLNAVTLTGTAATSASLTGTAFSNSIGTVNGFNAPSGFTLDDGSSLTVLGAVTGGPGVTVLDNGALVINGTVSATAISLTAGSITIPGTVSGSSVALFGTVGAISETGVLDAVTLTGSAATTASLTGTSFSDSIGTLGNFTASGFTLDDATNIIISGNVAGGPSVAISDNGTLTILAGGTVAATAIGLTANNITIPGLVTDGGGGSVNLMATAGTIGETGTLIAGTLSGSSAGATSLTGATPTSNQIAALGNFSASGFTLDDGAPLTVAGALAGGPSATVLDKGTLTVAAGGTVSATAIGLTSDAIAIPGLVTDGGSGTVKLVANTGAIGETGTVIAGTLSGSAAGSAAFSGATPTTNQIGTVSSFTAPGFTLDDGASLNVTGNLNGGPNVTLLDSGILTIAAGGTVSASAIGLTANSITMPGLVTDGGGGTVNLIADGGTINETGTLISGTLSGSSVGSTSLTGTTPTTNRIASIANFSAAGFTLNDGTNLAVNGTLAGGPNASVADSNSLTIGGTVTATGVSLTAGSIAIPGVITDGGSGSVSLIANGGAIGETGQLISGALSGSAVGAASLAGSNQVATLTNFTAAGFTLKDGLALLVSGPLAGGPSVTITDAAALTVGGSVTGTNVALTASNITIPGAITTGASGTVNLMATAGTIGETGTITTGTFSGSAPGAATIGGSVTGTAVTLTASNIDITIPGAITTGASGTVNLMATAGTIDEAGTITTGTFSGSAPGAATIGGSVTGTTVALTASNISIPGAVSDGGSGTTNLIATAGAIGETGAITAGTLSGSATAAASFTGPNKIAALGNFTTTGFTLNDGTNLAINGTVNGGPFASLNVTGTLTVNGLLLAANAIGINATGGIAIPGTVQDANSVSLITGGTISETGALLADLLTGSAGGAVALTGNAAGTSNQVLQLGSFTAGAFTMVDGSNLLISGTETAPYINIDAGGNSITLASGATIVTSGTPRPPGTVTVFPTAATSPVGAFLTSGGFTQQGSSFVSGIGGGPNIVRMDVTGAGNITFDQNGGLFGPTSWLIVSIGTGQATGNVFVQSLDVLRSGTSGSTTLTGSVAGLSGPAAAGAAGIQPGPNSNFRFNSCPISSVNCVLLPTQGVPTANPLNDINFGSVFNPDDQDDLLLPIVSDQDY